MSQEWKAPGAEEDDVQMPLGVGGDAPAEEYSAPSPKLRINSSTLALVLAFGAALVVLYFLGQQNKQRSASAAEVAKAEATDSAIQDWIRRHGNNQAVEIGPDKGDSLTRFLLAYLESTRTLTVEDPGVNPFEHVVKVEPIRIDPVTSEVVKQPVGEPVDPLLLEAAKEYSGLKLQLIMLGNPSSSSSAMINNQMVHVGTQFKYLTVTDITASCVVLNYKEKSFELKSANSGRP